MGALDLIAAVLMDDEDRAGGVFDSAVGRDVITCSWVLNVGDLSPGARWRRMRSASPPGSMVAFFVSEQPTMQQLA